jgi:hypothetical protein
MQRLRWFGFRISSPDKQCTLSGTNLFLIDSVASDAQFQQAVLVPHGFADSTLSVPRPNGTLLFINLRDDVRATCLPGDQRLCVVASPLASFLGTGLRA